MIRSTSALVMAAAILLASACGSADDDQEVTEPPAETAPLVDHPSSAAPTVATPATPLDPVPLADIDLDLEVVATIDTPIAMTTLPGDDGRVWVAQREGRLREIDLSEGGDGTQILDFSDEVSTSSEQGFLGVAVAPDGDHLYTSYSDPDGATRIDEYTLDSYDIDEGSRRRVFGLPQPFSNHNGGNIVFGPDGYLYLGLGDGGNAGDPDENGQNPATLLGSVLRIDPSAQGGQGDGSYGVPADNPFVDGGGRAEVWLYGVRNPWRFSFDRATGDLWIGDVGQFAIEEIDRLAAVDGVDAGKGDNLGWNLMEGSQEFAGTAPPDHVGPVHDYPHSPGNCSVTGGYVYRGDAIADLVGTYIYGDFCASEVRGLRVSAAGEVEEIGFEIGSDPGTLVSFGEDAAGELYVLSAAGEISRIVPG